VKVTVLWLINEKGEVLLARRAAHMTTDAGMWGPSVSGKIEAGEDAAQAAAREANEELGIDPMEIIPLHHLHNGTHHHKDGKLRIFSFLYSRVDSSLIDKMRLEPAEVAAIRWISLPGLQRELHLEPDTIVIGENKKIWDEIAQNLETVINSKPSRPL
jgi:8-oxo-dGTP pyrophosphatase MutT (NUDIX family)